MTVAPQIGRRFAGGASLTDGRHGTGVGGGRAGGAPSSGKTAAPRYCGEDRSRPLSSRRRPQDAGRRGECRRRTIPPADRRTANAGGDQSRRLPPRRRQWDEGQREEDRRRILPPVDRHAVNIGGGIVGDVTLPERWACKKVRR